MLSREQLAEISADELEAHFEQYGHGLTAEQLRQTRVALGHLYTAEAVFQPRQAREKPWEKRQHVTTLAKALRQEASLEPIVVLAMNGQRVVVDGHCRLKAYEEAGYPRSRLIPVRYLRGQPEGTLSDLFREALKYSAEANSKDKLSLTLAEKTEHAWRLIRFSEKRDCYSVREVARATGCSKSLAAEMKKTLTESLPFDPRDLSWADVKRQRRGEKTYDEDWQEQQTRDWEAKLRAAFGDKPNVLPDVFLEAAVRAYPRFASLLQSEVDAGVEEADF